MEQIKTMPDNATYTKTTSEIGSAPRKNKIFKGKSLNVDNAKKLTQTTWTKNSGNKGGGRSA